jgi:hypothetical protein
MEREELHDCQRRENSVRDGEFQREVAENSQSFHFSQGVDSEREFDDEPLEEDELISDTEDVPVCAVAVILASLSLTCTLQTQPDSAQIKKLATREKRRPRSEKLWKVSSK